MSIANVFLSHSSVDKPLVEKVADSLCRRGVIPWLDKERLLSGSSLTEKLREAIAGQTAVVLFLSENAAQSSWVEEELEVAIRLEDERNKDWIIPIYLSNPEIVVPLFKSLKRRWLKPDGKQVDRLGISIGALKNLEEKADAIAHEIAKTVYKHLKIKEKNKINIVIDQRGTGVRSDDYRLPENLEREEHPTLVFRPDMGTRTESETLTGEKWENWRRSIRQSLHEDIGSMNGKEIHVLGDGQLGIAFFLGEMFNRTHHITLYCHNERNNTLFTNEGQGFETSIEEGNPGGAVISSKLLEEKHDTIVLYIGRENYRRDVEAHIESLGGSLPLEFIKTDIFRSSEEVMEMVSKVVGLLKRFKDNGTKTVYIYTTLPFNVVPILSANLIYGVDNVKFMEYRRDMRGKSLEEKDKYVYLSMND